MLTSIAAYVLFTAGMIYLLFRRDNRLSKLYSSQEYYYELKNKNNELLGFHGNGNIGEGCVMVLLSPIIFILSHVANLQYFRTNLKYYLRGGARKRLDNVKEYVHTRIDARTKYLNEDKQYFDQYPDECESFWELQGLLENWDLREIVQDNSYQRFSKEYFGIPTPFKFWAGAVMSCLGLIFWPITVMAGFIFTAISISLLLFFFFK